MAHLISSVWWLCVFLLLVCLGAAHTKTDVVHVCPSAAGNDSHCGSSPLNACSSLQKALQVAKERPFGTHTHFVLCNATYKGPENSHLEIDHLWVSFEGPCRNAVCAVVLDLDGRRAMTTHHSNVSLTGIVFQNGSAVEGGVIQINESSVIVEYCSMNNNTATQNGGAIMVLPGNSSLLLRHTLFSSNTALEGSGGALFVAGSSSSAVLSVFDCTFDYNRAAQAGGAIASNAPTSVTSSHFSHNTATGTGDVRVHGGGLYLMTGTVEVSNCSFVANTAWARSGGTLLMAAGGGVYVCNDLFFNPYLQHTSFQDCLFEGNEAIVGDPEDYTDKTQVASGGGLFIAGHVTVVCNISVVRTVFVENTLRAVQSGPATLGGAGLCVKDWTFSVELQKDNLSISDTLFERNCARHSAPFSGEAGGAFVGGGMWISFLTLTGKTTPPYVVLHRVNFTGNKLGEEFCSYSKDFDSRGGGLGITGLGGPSILNISDSFFADNECWASADVSGVSQGGAIYAVVRGFFTMNGSTFIGNKASSVGLTSAISKGGAIAIECSGELPVVHLSDVGIMDSKATVNAGKLSGNSAFGGGIFLVFGAARVTLERITISRNRAEAPSSSQGGGMYVGCPDSARRAGEGMFLLQGCLLKDNIAGTGGEESFLWGMGGALSLNPNVPFLLNATSFLNNKASLGGAVCLQAQYFVTVAFQMAQCLFDTNQATTEGGALFVSENSWNSLTVTGSVFRKNSGTVAGGIFWSSQRSTLLIDHTLLLDNEAYATASALVVKNGLWSVRHSRVSGDLEPPLIDARHYWTGDFEDNRFDCPTGCPLVKTFGHWGPHQWQQIFCQPCGRDQYSVINGSACRPCPSHVGAVCRGRDDVRATRRYQLLLNATGGLVPLLCPPGYGCLSDMCDWRQSCAPGRDPHSPFCGRCLVGHSEVFGSESCVPEEECGSWLGWVLLGVGFCVLVAYVLWQLLLKPVPRFGVMKSTLFFFQTADLLIASGGSLISFLGRFFSALFNLRLDSATTLLSSGICIVPMSGDGKIMFGYLPPFLFFIVLGCAFVASRFLSWFRKRKHVVELEEPVESSSLDSAAPSQSLSSRFGLALLSLILAAYSSITKTTFALLDCRTVEGQSNPVLFLSGQYSCYTQWFQIVAIALWLPIILSFPLILIAFVYLRKRKQGLARSGSGATWFHFLTVCNAPRCYYWESILMLRRLVLIVLATFVGDTLWRDVSLSLVCVLLLVVNFALHPFATRWTHTIESLMLLLLLLLSLFNSVRVGWIVIGQSLMMSNEVALDVLNVVVFITAVVVAVRHVMMSNVLSLWRRLRLQWSTRQERKAKGEEEDSTLQVGLLSPPA